MPALALLYEFSRHKFVCPGSLRMSSGRGNAPDERAQHILRTLVQQFIRDGQPVGSKKLSQKLAQASGLSVSPATIRNVMSDLEDFGFIASPHTSAGRIPTPKGYRFFVDTLVQLRQPAAREISQLQTQLSDDPTLNSKLLAETASTALSSLTSLASIVTLPRQQKLTLRQIEFLPIADRRILAILVVNDSEVQNRVLHLERDYTPDELQRAANFLNDNYVGKDIRDVRSLVVEELQRTQQTMNQLMIDTVTIAEQALSGDSSDKPYVIAGQTKLMGFEELSDIEQLRQLFEAFSQQREILGLLDRSIEADGIQIFIGEESGYQILDNCSVVTAPYRVNEEIVGVLGVIGPTRMAYERVIPIVDVTAKLVGAALNSGH
jgi:heat-inducible transcriptional repressor